jgi:hypothetical protein
VLREETRGAEVTMKKRVVVPAAVLVATLLLVLVWTEFGRPIERGAPVRGASDQDFHPTRGSEVVTACTLPAPTPAAVPVRDLADGTTVEGVAFVAGRGLVPAGTGLVAVSREEEATAAGVLWACGDLRVLGTVTGKSLVGTLDPREAAISVALEEGDPGDDGGPGEGPGRDWLAEHGLSGPFGIDPVGPDGAFSAVLPRVAGLVAQASAPGWATVRVGLPASPAVTETQVRFLLTRAIAVEGRLTDANGRPVEGALVTGYVQLRVPAEACTPEALAERYPEGGLTTVRRGGEETALLTLNHSCRTRGDGGFRLVLREQGEVRLLALPPGGAPIARSLGEIGEVPAPLALTAEPATRPGATVCLVQRGRPLAGVQVAVSDQTDPDLTPGWVTGADDEGRIAAEWLLAGRRYAFTLLPAGEGSPEGRVVVPWRDQGEVSIPRPCRR